VTPDRERSGCRLIFIEALLDHTNPKIFVVFTGMQSTEVVLRSAARWANRL